MEIIKGAINGVALDLVLPMVDSVNRPAYLASAAMSTGNVKIARMSSTWQVTSIVSCPQDIAGMTTHKFVRLAAGEMTHDDDSTPIVLTFHDASGTWDDNTVLIRTGNIGARVASMSNGVITGAAFDLSTAFPLSATNGSTLSAIGDTRMANLNATVSSRAIAGDLMGIVTSGITSSKYDNSTAFALGAANGSTLSNIGDTRMAYLNASVAGVASAAAVQILVTPAQTIVTDINGFVTATLATSQPNYAPAKAGDLMGIVTSGITSNKYDNSTTFPLAFVDSGATGVARTGADSDTLETLSDQVDPVQRSTATMPCRFIAVTGEYWLFYYATTANMQADTSRVYKKQCFKSDGTAATNIHDIATIGKEEAA